MTELTDDEINDIWASVSPHDGEVDMIEYARAIEKALNEKKMPQPLL